MALDRHGQARDTIVAQTMNHWYASEATTPAQRSREDATAIFEEFDRKTFAWWLQCSPQKRK
eukprot:2582241-Amphidinium_carterae.1